MNLFKQEMYRSQLKHGLEWKKHKYLYKDENGNYVYPDDLRKNLDGNAKTKVGSRVNVAINKKKAELRSIGRGENYGNYPGSPIGKLQSESNIQKKNAANKKAESDKWERGEYLDKDDKGREDRERKSAKLASVEAEAKSKKAKADYDRAVKDRENYENASGFEKDLGKALVKREAKKNEKKDKKYKKEHAAELEGRAAKEKADDERYKNYVVEKKEEYMRKMAEATKEKERKDRKKSPDSEDASKVSGKALGSFIVSTPLNKLKKKKKSAVKHSDEPLRSNVMNLYQREMYRSSLQHGVKGQRAAHHKYLYIDANGRYVYPEDVPKGTTGIQQHHAQVLSDRRQAKKDKAYSKETKGINDRIDNQLGVSGASRMIRSTQQMTNAHQGSTGYGGLDSYGYRMADADKAKAIVKQRKLAKAMNNAEGQRKSAHAGYEEDRRTFSDHENTSTEELERQKEKTTTRKQQANAEGQRKSAHAGYEEDKRLFPDGGSTEELERQKKKTKARKSAAKRFNENDQSLKREAAKGTSKRKELEQINSAHRMATDTRDTYKKPGYKTLMDTNYYDTSGSVERQKRKTALRKRHKK